MLRWLKVLLAVAGLLSADVAIAAAPPSPPPISVLGGTTSLAVTSVTANVVLPAVLTSFPVVVVRNTGLNTVYVASGISSVTATTSGIPVLPGDTLPLWVTVATNNYIAGITAAGTSSLTIYQWNGAPPILFGGGTSSGGGGGGSVVSLLPASTYQGTMTLGAATSTTLTSGNVTMNAGGGALPTTFQKITIINTGTNAATVCWFGGTCSAALGSETLAAGATDTVNLNGFATAPTLFSTLGTTLSFRN